MQEYWEIYMKPIEGKPASVLFNAGIYDEIESDLKHTHPTVGFVKVALKNPNPKGLLSEQEEPDISYLEDKLEAASLKFRIGKYVGRIISDGYVTFLYYLQFTYNWQDFLDFALVEHAHYAIEAGYRDDPEWQFYRNLLFPNAKEWQIIQNHKVCDALKANGDMLHLPRAIEHRIYFTDRTEKDALAEALKSEGFGIQGEIENDEGVKGLACYRIDKPFYDAIDELTLRLIDLCETYGAVYDGWETSIVKG